MSLLVNSSNYNINNMLPLSTWHNGLKQNLDYAKYRLDLHPDLMNIVFITDIHTNCEYGVRFNPYCYGKAIDNKNLASIRGASSAWYNNLNTINKLDRICVLIKKLSKLKKIDLIILGGDYLSNGLNTTAENAKKAFYEVNSCIKKLKDIAPILICKGNHDSNTMTTFNLRVTHLDYINLIYNDIPFNSNVIYGNANRDYGYYDDVYKKIRVIYLNSNEINVEGIPEYAAYTGKLSDNAYHKYNPQYVPFMSQTLLEFLINALTIKDNGWTVVIFEHHPVDDFRYFDHDTYNYVANIFASFRHNKKGVFLKTWSSSALFNLNISWDFTQNGSNNSIFLVNGHLHTPRTLTTIYTKPNGDTITLSDPGSSTDRFALTSMGAEALKSANDDTVRESAFDIIQVDAINKSLIFNHVGGNIDGDINNSPDIYGGSSRIMYEDDATFYSLNRFGITNKVAKYYIRRLTKTLNVNVINTNKLAILDATVTLSFNGFDRTLHTNDKGIASFTYMPYDKCFVYTTISGYKSNTTQILNIDTKNITIELEKDDSYIPLVEDYTILDSISSLKGRTELNKVGAYIDTGVPINQNSIRIETAFRAESIDGTNIFGDTDILGCATRPTYSGLRLYYEWSKTKTTLNIQSGSSLHNSKSYFELLTNPSASKNTIIIEATNGQPLSVTLNGSKITSNGNVNLNCDGTILLMASCIEESIYTGKLTLYPTKIYVNNILVRDYIPVKLKISNKVGLMDLVENKFYDSVNGEPFTYYSEDYPKFNNPLVSERNMADPTVWDGEDGYYYAWYTGTIKENVIVPLYKSKDLITWTNTNTFPLEKSERIKIEELGKSLSTYSCWAPEIVKISNTQWNLYLSLDKYYMMAFKSNNPTRNFTFDKILIANNTKVGSNQIGLSGNIDPCVRKDEDGRLWMFWGSMSGIWRVELTSDGLNLVSNAIKTHVAGGWTDKGNRNNIFEGPYLYKRNNWWYLFVSSGLYNRNYRLRVGRASSLTGDFKDINGISLTEAQNATPDTKGNLTVNGVTNFAPILLEGKYSQQQFYDPGHNGTIVEDINGKTFMFFHARVTSEGNSGVNRRLCMSEIFWDNDGWPYFAFENDSGHGIVTTSSYGPKLN